MVFIALSPVLEHLWFGRPQELFDTTPWSDLTNS
jgi:hypothetical protein